MHIPLVSGTSGDNTLPHVESPIKKETITKIDVEDIEVMNTSNSVLENRFFQVAQKQNVY